MKKIAPFLLKSLAVLALLGLVVGKLFFPKTLEETVIAPARRMPVFGQVLGSTWDTLGKVGPSMTTKTVQLADTIQSSDLGMDERVRQIVESQDPKQAAASLVEKTVDESLTSLGNLPASTLKRLREEMRQELYQEICTGWLKEEE